MQVSAPKLSFIVLSYNYADLIGQTIRSILAQTVQDFEIVVVDDASRDASREVVAGFADPRIHLLVNETNRGGAASYNRAVAAARGEWLVNLDADDWITPDKCEKQLAFLRENPVAVLGTHTAHMDRAGQPHPNQRVLDPVVNGPHDLNAIENWIGMNRLVRSSTMVSRAAHMAVGPDDPAMTRAPDYELWTRFLRHGHRFAVLPEKLTFYRLHGSGVTHGDPIGSLLEMSYATVRNLVPLIESRAAWPALLRVINVWAGQEAFARLRPIERYRMAGMLLLGPPGPDYAAFRATVLAEEAGAAAALTDAGRRLLALVLLAQSRPVQPAWRRAAARLGRAALGRDRAARVRHALTHLIGASNHGGV